MASRREILGYAAAAGLMLATGCARWNQPSNEGTVLPMTQMSPDSVVLEVAVLRVPLEHQEAFGEIWQQADEQHLSIDVRRRLAQNGFRSGIIGPQLPATIRELLATRTDVTQHVAGEESVVMDVTARTNRYQVRAGRVRKVPCTGVEDSLLALISEQGTVRGETYEKAQGLLALKPFPQGDGRVRLEITPEIEYGEPKSRRIGQEGTWQLNVARDSRVFEQLRMEAHLSPGQTMLLTTIDQPRGLAKEFLTAATGSGRQRRAVLIRLAQTQYDNLFTPNEIVEPLVTPGD